MPEGMSFEEIAKKLEITPQYARRLFNEGMLKLKLELREHPELLDIFGDLMDSSADRYRNPRCPKTPEEF